MIYSPIGLVVRFHYMKNKNSRYDKLYKGFQIMHEAWEMGTFTYLSQKCFALFAQSFYPSHQFY